MPHWELTVLALLGCACMKEPPTAPETADTGPTQTARAKREPQASAADPPPPAGVVLPKIFADEPPRPGQFDRSSLWVVTLTGGSVQHEVPADTLEYPELREVLRVLFAGPPPADPTRFSTPSLGEQLRIEWREHGKTIAISRLFGDGTLIREQAGTSSVDRRLSPAALAELAGAIERAGLAKADRRFGVPPQSP